MEQPLFDGRDGGFPVGGRRRVCRAMGLSADLSGRRIRQSARSCVRTSCGSRTRRRTDRPRSSRIRTRPCTRRRLQHSRLRWLTRELELWHDTPRARLTVRLASASGELPEFFFRRFHAAVPRDSCPPPATAACRSCPTRTSCPGPAATTSASTSWLNYATPAGQWLWATRDAPLVTFSDHQVLARAGRGTRADQPGAGDAVQQHLVHQLRGGQPWGAGIPVRSGLDAIWQRLAPTMP